MLKIMSNGRVPNRSIKPRPSPPNPPLSAPLEPLNAEQARKLILAGQAWEGMRVIGHLNFSRQSNLYTLPKNLTCASLDISDCVNLTQLPDGLHVSRWIELAGSGIQMLPPGHGFELRWRGVRVSDRIAFASPQSVTGKEILDTNNVELRRILIERLGYEVFLQQVGGIIRDRDQDAGGERQLVSIPFEDDEALMLLKVICPSTRHVHVLRVPPYIRSCHQAAAWIAGFDNPHDYHPLIEA